MSSRPITQQLLSILRKILPDGNTYPDGSIYVDDDYYRAGPQFPVGQVHNGIDFYYANATLNSANGGHPNVYAPVTGTLLELSPLEGGVGSVFIRGQEKRCQVRTFSGRVRGEKVSGTFSGRFRRALD